jgi:Protein of unknown function (DUF3187)
VRPRRTCLTCIFAAAFLTRPCLADEFFLVRDENPLTRGFYLPLPSDSRAAAGASFSATLLIANTLNVENDPHEKLRVDGESDTLTLTYENSLSSSWRYRLTLPIIHDSGGFLDPAINTWHRWFGFDSGNRPFFPNNKLNYSYTGQGIIDLQHAGTHIGDLAGEVGWFAADDAHKTLSLWGGVEAPTGSVSALTSDGAWDGALWVHGAWRWTHWQLAAELGVTEPFGDELFSGGGHRTSAFGRAALTRSLGSAWSLRAQLDGQTGHVVDSDSRFLGTSLQFSIGMSRRLKGRWHLDFGFIEDAAVNTAPDITFFVGVRN